MHRQTQRRWFLDKCKSASDDLFNYEITMIFLRYTKFKFTVSLVIWLLSRTETLIGIRTPGFVIGVHEIRWTLSVREEPRFSIFTYIPTALSSHKRPGVVF